MDRTKELIAERVKLYEENKALLDRADRARRTLSGAEQAEFDRRDARSDEIRRTLDAMEKTAAEERELGTSRGRKTSLSIVDRTASAQADLALRAWAAGSRATAEQAAAAERAGLNYLNPELETRALSSVTATQGQASIPDEIVHAYWDAQKWFGRVRNVSTVIPTLTGAPMPIPTTDDTGNTGEIVADGGPITTTADPTFGVVNLGAFKYSSKAVIVPWELLQDSAINLAVYLGAKLGERVARKQNNDFTVGAGTTLPYGVAVQASLGKTAAATNAITFDEVIDLYASVDVAYRSKPNFRFMMSDTVATYLRKLKDSQNRYLWEMSLQAGQPDRILGAAVEINNDMSAAFTTGQKLILCGDFSAYHIRDAGPVQLIRDDSVRLLNGQIVFLAWQRSDGALTEANAIRYLRTA